MRRPFHGKSTSDLASIASSAAQNLNRRSLKEVARELSERNSRAAKALMREVLYSISVIESKEKWSGPVDGEVESGPRVNRERNPSRGSTSISYIRGEDFERVAIGMIRTAERQIMMGTYIFTSKNLAEAIVSASENIDILVLVGGRSERDRKANRSVASMLEEASVPVLSGEVHAKFIIKDKRDVLLGSSNAYDCKSLDSNVCIINSRPMAMDLLLHIREYWEDDRITILDDID